MHAHPPANARARLSVPPPRSNGRRENEEEEEEYRENDEQALFVSISWNEFGDSSLGAAASIEVNTTGRTKEGGHPNQK